eukprot:TRINITY_DN6647_c0_g1_i1.p1 TRINITY_DN6647_c0_g1~~TRINITY_DN6647_c0_g1_i1.p1  ORF type:complete len:683 (-),score=128.39 TRINITY_DN6647_c0_g1_i1:83-2089(-)
MVIATQVIVTSRIGENSANTAALNEANGDTLASTQAPMRQQTHSNGHYGTREAQAAVSLQRNFRGYQTRKNMTKNYRKNYGGSGDTAPIPVGKLLGVPYAELHLAMPQVSESKRYGVRDITIERVLLQLGVPAKYTTGRRYEVVSKWWLKEVRRDPNLLPACVHKQMKWSHLFMDPSPPSRPLNAPSDGYVKPTQAHYLLGQFDVLGIPVRADFDSGFEPFATVEAKDDSHRGRRGGGYHYTNVDHGEVRPDCDSPESFAGWFWVLHAAAPNIGESPNAEDFVDYSTIPKEPAKATTSKAACWKPMRGSYRRLDEDLYISHMGRLWQNALTAMGRLKIEDGIFFPFGMGAFLRQLGKNDDNYEDEATMRKLRARVADQLIAAIGELCCGHGAVAPTGPRRVHICLVCVNKESFQNHNVFVEAAKKGLDKYKNLLSVLQFRMNVDCLQLAHELTVGNGPQTQMKVGLLNGANRTLMGNHWFSHGAKMAIDENLHRRSATMARAALLFNMGFEAEDEVVGTEPTLRRPNELKENWEFFKGLKEKVTEGPTAPASTSPAEKPADKHKHQAAADTEEEAGKVTLVDSDAGVTAKQAWEEEAPPTTPVKKKKGWFSCCSGGSRREKAVPVGVENAADAAKPSTLKKKTAKKPTAAEVKRQRTEAVEGHLVDGD